MQDNTPNLGNLFGGDTGGFKQEPPAAPANGQGTTDAPTGTPPAAPGAPTPGEGDNNPPNPPAPSTPPTPPADPVDTYEGVVQFLQKDQLTESEQEIKDGFDTLFGASNVDAQGNLVDNSGRIVVTAADLKKYVENDELPLNENGDIVDAEGKVIKSNLDLTKENSIVGYAKLKMEQDLGIQFPDDAEFPDDEDGVAALAMKAAELKSQGAISKFLTANPLLKDFYQHLALGNDVKSFTGDGTDYSKINVKELSREAKIQLIETSYKEQNLANPTKFIDILKKGGDEAIDAEVTDAINTLSEIKETRRKENDKVLKEQEKARRESIEKYWNDVKAIVDKGRVKDITIPSADRENFLNYMSKVVKDGKSQEALDMETESEEFDVMVSFLRYKKYDISKLAKVIAKNDKVLSMRERMQKAKRAANPSKSFGNANANNKGLSLDSLI